MIYKTKDIVVFVGHEKSENQKVKVLPFIFNKDFNKIKVLSDNKIIKIENENPIASLEENYNLKVIEYASLEESINLKNITESELLEITNIMVNFYETKEKFKKSKKEAIEEYNNF